MYFCFILLKLVVSKCKQRLLTNFSHTPSDLFKEIKGLPNQISSPNITAIIQTKKKKKVYNRGCYTCLSKAVML